MKDQQRIEHIAGVIRHVAAESIYTRYTEIDFHTRRVKR